MKTNILLIGMPGCGKSSIGSTLAKELNLKYVDMDDYIEQKCNTTISEMFKNGEKYFRDIETEVAKELSKREDTLISAGGGVVVREENMKYLKSSSTVIFINRSVKNLLKSKSLGTNRPLLRNNEQHVHDLYKQRIDLYRKYADFEVENNGYFRNTIGEIKNKLNEI